MLLLLPPGLTFSHCFDANANTEKKIKFLKNPILPKKIFKNFKKFKKIKKFSEFFFAF